MRFHFTNTTMRPVRMHARDRSCRDERDLPIEPHCRQIQRLNRANDEFWNQAPVAVRQAATDNAATGATMRDRLRALNQKLADFWRRQS